jgi:hypothetical protein
MRYVLGVLLFGASALAFAHSCPKEMKAIDAKLQSGHSLNAEQLGKVKSLRADGERLHQEGKHDASMKALGEAKEILGM